MSEVAAFLSWLLRARDQIDVRDAGGYLFAPTLVSRVREGLARGRERRAVRDDAETQDTLDADIDARDPAFVSLMVDFFRAINERYFRCAVYGSEHLPAEGAALLVGNHSGGVVVNDVFLAHVAVHDALGADRAMHVLGHDFAVDEPVMGRYMRRFGVLRANHQAAARALARGHLVLTYPGSDRDTFRPFRERHQVHLSGRKGFVRLAKAAGVPIIPVATVGTHEQLVVLARGERLARALGTKALFRSEILPITLSVPWGLSVGFLPYVPLPAQTTLAFGPPLHVDDVDLEAGYERVERALQDLMDSTVARRQDRRRRAA